MTELLLLRELAHGDLPTREEARFAAAMDRSWQVMTDEEQEAVERDFARKALTGAPLRLNEIAASVQIGSHDTPRRARAA
ncbi:MAG: hypothetical protein EXR72_19785 [Myxococcales bacterium]|nr:hypothetical protein [Myxococcales bacterium]